MRSEVTNQREELVFDQARRRIKQDCQCDSFLLPTARQALDVCYKVPESVRGAF